MNDPIETLTKVPSFGYAFLIGAAGAASAEVLKAYEIKGKLTTQKYKRMMRSFVFWSVVIGMIAAAGFITWAVNAKIPASELQLLATGICCRSIVREFFSAGASRRRLQLGANDNKVVSDMFM